MTRKSMKNTLHRVNSTQTARGRLNLRGCRKLDFRAPSAWRATVSVKCRLKVLAWARKESMQLLADDISASHSYVPVWVRAVEPTSAQRLRAGPITIGVTQDKSELALQCLDFMLLAKPQSSTIGGRGLTTNLSISLVPANMLLPKFILLIGFTPATLRAGVALLPDTAPPILPTIKVQSHLRIAVIAHIVLRNLSASSSRCSSNSPIISRHPDAFVACAATEQ
jgi:hypothetical protein